MFKFFYTLEFMEATSDKILFRQKISKDWLLFFSEKIWEETLPCLAVNQMNTKVCLLKSVDHD